MPTLTVITRRKEARTVVGEPGLSVMEVLRSQGFDEVQALCGGACACATCHVYVDPAQAELLPPMTSDESDLLDSSAHRRTTSRLACQIPFTNELGGLCVTIAPED